VTSQFPRSPLLPPNFDVGEPTLRWSSQLPALVGQGFCIVATTKQRGWLLDYAEVTIPVDDRDRDLLVPFVTGQEQLTAAETNTAAPGSGTSTNVSALSAPAKPADVFRQTRHSRGGSILKSSLISSFPHLLPRDGIFGLWAIGSSYDAYIQRSERFDGLARCVIHDQAATNQLEERATVSG
jgi:hypothetical protein